MEKICVKSSRQLEPPNRIKVKVTPQNAYLELDRTLTSDPGQIRLHSSVTMPRAGLYRFRKIRPIAAVEMMFGIRNILRVNFQPRIFLDSVSATRMVNGTWISSVSATHLSELTSAILKFASYRNSLI